LMTSTTADPKRFFFPAYFDILLFMWLLACPLSGEHVNEAPILWYLFLIYIPFLSIRELCLFRNINYFFILIFKNFKPRICQLYIFFWQKINTRIVGVLINRLKIAKDFLHFLINIFFIFACRRLTSCRTKLYCRFFRI
jgi:hypothetical protein